jgi:hypothetical protein
MSPIEKVIVTKLVHLALDQGYAISVFDGEDYPLKRSRNEDQILDALASSDSDDLVLRDTEHGHRIGSITLIWGNDVEVISDHSDNAATNEVVARTMMEFDGSAA